MEPVKSFTPKQAAQRIGVSTATIRNWVKAGELERIKDDTTGRWGITLQSIERCEDLKIGSIRLVSRANKQHKIQNRITQRSNNQYDESLSESRRNIEGVYYTPKKVVQDMLRNATIGDNLSDKLLIDPCCGSGNFLIEAISIGFRPENVYGYEIDPRAAKIARRRIFELTGYRTRNIISGDFLAISNTSRRQYDYCVTNPPWGRKMDSKLRDKRAERFAVSRSADSSSIFLLASMEILKDGGRLNFLLPESLLTVRAHSHIRRYALEYEIDSITDYGRVFPSLLTSAIAISLSKKAATIGAQIACRVGENSYKRDRNSFLNNPMQVLNIWTTPQEAEVIEALFERDHITLKGGASWGIGIVTGNNAEYIKSELSNGYREVVKGADILPISSEGNTKVEIKRDQQYIKDDFAAYHQVAPIKLYDAPEKIIYKFISERLYFAIDKERLLTLNSANVLVPNPDFPLSCEKLAMILNSDLMSWLFRALFHTRKVLRGDLESLPLFPDYFATNEKFQQSSYLEWLGINERFRDILR